MNELNKQLQAILNSINRFHNQELDVQGIQQNLAASAPAISGDVPKEIVDAIENAEEKIEEIIFTVNSDEQFAEVIKLLDKLQKKIAEKF